MDNRVETWKKQLLDLGKRNRLINFLEGKRNNVKITAPSFERVWELVVSEQEIVFPYAKGVQVDDDGEEIYDAVIKGDVETGRGIGDLQKTLKSLRYKANTSMEEQGINTLYLTFGMLKWKEQDGASQVLSSPVILVPVKLLIESITSPYRMVLHEDEIVVNPTLAHKLDNDFGIVMPEFDSSQETPEEYLEKLADKVAIKGWEVERSVHLTNLSFLKINMYKDLERNAERLNASAIIAALVGEQLPPSISPELHNFDHDRKTRPIDTYQVVDADSSQQDAVLLSKKGVSFVLQGPPGTGKSQTITNIISEAIADGRKILFVSEKMAALQVVYNRLANAGLADFCFTLHSHKAKKKEILRDLANSINIDRTRVLDEALAQLDMLERKRSRLNEYQAELHTPVSGLNVSIFQVNGRLAKLNGAPDIVFGIPDVDKVTSELLSEREYLLNELSKTIGRKSEDYADNVWRDSSVKFLSNALRHEIDSNIAMAVPLLEELEKKHSLVCANLGINTAPSFKGNEELLSILWFAAKSPTLPAAWTKDYNVAALIENARKYKEKNECIVKITNELSEKYSDAVLDIDAVEYKDRLCGLMLQLHTRFRGDDSEWISQNITRLNEEITSISGGIDSLFREAGELASRLGMPAPATIDDIILQAEAIGALAEIQKVRPTHKWFDSDDLSRIRSEVKAQEDLHRRLAELRDFVLSRFDKEILDWDFYPVLQRFRTEYKTLFRKLNGKYRKDIKQLRSYLSTGGSLPYSEALEVLNKLKAISDTQAVITDNQQQYREDFGSYYAGLNTQWDLLGNDLENFGNSIPHIHAITPQLQEIMVGGLLPISDIAQFKVTYSKTDVTSALERLKSILACDMGTGTKWEDIREHVREAGSVASAFISLYQDIVKMHRGECHYESVISDLELLVSLGELKGEFASQNEANTACYGNYYDGLATDWGKLIAALEYTLEFKILISLHHLSEAFVRNICENTEIISYCNDEYLKMSEMHAEAKSSIAWFASLFDNGEEFYQCSIPDLVCRMLLCRDRKHLLEEWVDYCTNREKCEQAGLGEFVNTIVDSGIDPNHIVDSYLKRFYRLWLDAILPGFPAVQSFRGRIQAQTINEFREYDKGQFKIAQARVRERALSRIPDLNSINGARDEIAILKRELNKQRRLMPLRKLFMSIPNLITSLRPCFMMSPLSVSVFLEAQSYDFDLVIFDEASQVHTEDAIGAIMRGKQVIIVGDTKQLPPTSFFSTSINDDDFDVDSNEAPDDDQDACAYESILDESVAVLPERSLRWHYRSRHEHLIAFSNIKIYNNQLITFPSPVASAQDCGVEYVYVKDGVYDRGGKKNNIVEARKVADLVFEHFSKYPDRSLGVVTFSEAQQNAVDAAIRQKRLQNPDFDRFFIEDKEEPFFIKNLENVQGDERDTIIFSIGYAKDNRGVMYMNFGPLSREGGYRRLNVAITRAKYNIKLVGSIVPSDIELDKVSSEGVRMLRHYIEFAQQGIRALERELTFDGGVVLESPFEEAIYDFLQSKGYNVVTQVGCSGFRIDMAVKHPVERGKFAIGIECDGATYHSSRTARERDRLRQSILESMGWNIYRVWSTDWIKDPATEGAKLINAIEKAFTAAESGYEHRKQAEENKEETIIPLINIEEKVEPSETGAAGYDFELYKRADLLKISTDNGRKRKKSDIVWDIISMEQPIHFEELCRRIAPVFDRQKVTSVVRTEVGNIFRKHLAGKIIKDSNEFVRIKDFADLKVRVPDPDDDYVRSIAYISNEELALAMKTIVQRSFGITPEDLFIVTAREFGFRRTGENIISALSQVYEKMLGSNEVSEIDGKISIEH